LDGVIMNLCSLGKKFIALWFLRFLVRHFFVIALFIFALIGIFFGKSIMKKLWNVAAAKVGESL